MESVATYVIFLIKFVGHGIEESIRRHSAVECVVENYHLRRMWHECVDGTKPAQMTSVVNRCEVDETFDSVFDFLCDYAAFLEQIASLHDSVSNGIDFVEVF